MTKKQKIIITSIIILLVLSYAGTLGLFATQNDEKPSEDSDSPGWTKALSSVMSVFAEKVTLDDIKCNNSPVSSEFTLDSSSATSGSCTIDFTEGRLPEYKDRDENTIWKTEVEVLSDTTVYIQYKPGESCKGETTLPKSGLVLMHLASQIDENGDIKKNKYYKESDLTCWLKQEDSTVSFTISQAGESLILKCAGECGTPIKLKLIE